MALDEYRLLYPDLEIVSGGAPGADSLAQRYAIIHDLPYTEFPAKWSKYGRSAGFIRNVDIADYSDEAIAFWDAQSKGTKHTIDLCKKLHKTVVVIDYLHYCNI